MLPHGLRQGSQSAAGASKRIAISLAHSQRLPVALLALYLASFPLAMALIGFTLVIGAMTASSVKGEAQGAAAMPLAAPPFRVGSEALRDDRAGPLTAQPKSEAKNKMLLGKDNSLNPGAQRVPGVGSHKIIRHT